MRADDSSVEDVLRQMARQAGLTIKFAHYDPTTLTQWRTPLVVQLKDGQVGIIQVLGDDEQIGIAYSGDLGLQSSIDRQTLLDNALRTVILRPARPVSDVRTNDYIKPYDEHWFRKIVLRDLRPYGHVMLASLVANVLGLGGVLFSMQVYDRVIPAESLPTLYVLFGGVLLAIVFDFIMRIMRMKITDLLGKRADLRVSDLVFGHALRLRNSARPKSTGSFISQLRELESLRDLITSSTATALADLPFFLIFLVVFYLIGGPLVLIPLCALVAMVVPGLLAQRKLARLANESMRESALRNAMLVETVQGMDDIKSLQAEQRFQQQWNHYNAVAADSSLRLRTLTNGLVAWTQNVQSAVFAIVIVFGAPMVIAGDLTTGSLVAASILASRMMAPVSQLTHVLTRWQQAKVALEGLNRLMLLRRALRAQARQLQIQRGIAHPGADRQRPDHRTGRTHRGAGPQRGRQVDPAPGIGRWPGPERGQYHARRCGPGAYRSGRRAPRHRSAHAEFAAVPRQPAREPDHGRRTGLGSGNHRRTGDHRRPGFRPPVPDRHGSLDSGRRPWPVGWPAPVAAAVAPVDPSAAHPAARRTHSVPGRDHRAPADPQPGHLGARAHDHRCHPPHQRAGAGRPDHRGRQRPGGHRRHQGKRHRHTVAPQGRGLIKEGRANGHRQGIQGAGPR